MFLPTAKKGPPPRPRVMTALGEDGRAQIRRFLESLPAHRPTPLVALPALAADRGVAAIHVKDEGKRFHLTSFKALGGAYAVASLALKEAEAKLGRPFDFADLSLPEVRAVAARTTFACATDGNHGRSVAWGAELAGAACQIFIHKGVSAARAAAMAAFGATINRVEGSYDDSIRIAAETAEREGWTVVSDTAWDGYEDIPLTVMQGYTATIGEALDVLAAPPTHIFVQAGVGGIAAAIAAYAHQRLSAGAAKIVVVEPTRAACLHASATAGHAVTISHGEPTVMAMLECATPSPLAWEVLHHFADGYVTLAEEEAMEAMRLLASPLPGDAAIVAGESGCTGLAGALQCLDDPDARAHLRLSQGSRILVINSEGATDAAIYAGIVGKTPQQVEGQ